MDLEVNSGAWVARRDQPGQWLGTSVQGHGARRRRWVDHEAVVNIWIHSTQREWLVGFDMGISCGIRSWDSGGINREVRRGAKLHVGPFNGWSTGKVEVAVTINIVAYAAQGYWIYSRVVCEVDDRFFGTTKEFRFVLDTEHHDFLAINLLCAGGIDGLDQDLTGVSFVAILALQRELDTLSAVQTLDSRDLSDSNLLGTFPYLFTPALVTAMEGVGAIVGGQCVTLAVQVVDLGILDAVGDSADGLAKEWGVMRYVEVLRWETLNDVDSSYGYGLNDGAERQEGDFGSGRHDCCNDVVRAGGKRVYIEW